MIMKCLYFDNIKHEDWQVVELHNFLCLCMSPTLVAVDWCLESEAVSGHGPCEQCDQVSHPAASTLPMSATVVPVSQNSFVLLSNSPVSDYQLSCHKIIFIWSDYCVTNIKHSSFVFCWEIGNQTICKFLHVTSLKSQLWHFYEHWNVYDE